MTDLKSCPFCGGEARGAVNIVYTERLGNACKSLSIEMYMTFNELMEFVAKIMNEQP